MNTDVVSRLFLLIHAFISLSAAGWLGVGCSLKRQMSNCHLQRYIISLAGRFEISRNTVGIFAKNIKQSI